MKLKSLTLVCLCLIAGPIGVADLQAASQPGLIVVVDASSAADLLGYAKEPSTLVHGLVRDTAAETELRNALLASGKTGRVTVSVWDGKRIPFVENTVNRIVCKQVTDDIRRALAPYGLAIKRDGSSLWTKPYPKQMDEWPQHLYQSNGNNVSKDTIAGPPRRIQWVGAPRKLRHHDHLPSLSAMVTAKGRVYYIFDEQTAASILFPPQWSLIARDAFNGVVLWKKEIAEWHPHLWPLKSMPATLPRRLVSVDDDVYVTLGIGAPVSHLNGSDGQQVKVFAGSEKCEEIVVHENTLFALCLTGKGPLDDMDAGRGKTGKDPRATGFPLLQKLMGSNKSPLWLRADRRLIAYDITSGKKKWHVNGTFAPLSVATDGKRVYSHNGKSLFALDYATGKKLWTSPQIPIWRQFYANYGARLVVHDGVVVFSGGENYSWVPPGSSGADDTMTAVSAGTGKKLWTAKHPSSGYRSHEDLFIAGGLVWAPDSTQNTKSPLMGLDPSTGKVVRKINMNLGYSFHHRCYPGRATEKYMFLSLVGVNSVPFDGASRSINDQWVRGACGYGFMPANGMIYATPDPCNCFPESSVDGFAGLAPADPKLAAFRKQAAASIKTEQGQKYDGDLSESSGEWSTYRGNAGRTASTGSALPASFQPVWKAEIGGRLSAPVVAGGKVFLSRIDENQVIAIDSATGKTAWTYVTGSRVDSPPTVVGKLLYFGSADGYVTCLKTDTGSMIWRRRIAPTDEKIVDEGRVESVWPVHGAVTYHNKLIYAVAGRNMFVDSGLRLCALDPLTGDAKFTEAHALESSTAIKKKMNAIPSKPDILAAQGNNLYMRSLVYDLQCRKSRTKTRHIFAVNGYLDDSWFHRAFWTYASSWIGGDFGFGMTGERNHSGRIMIHDGTAIYGFGRKKYGWGSSFSYKLYKASSNGPVKSIKSGKKRGNKSSPIWSVDIPVLARSIVKAGDKLIVTGPEKLYDENVAIQKLEEASTSAKVKAQAANWKMRADLLVISSADGKVEKEVRFDFAPVWDGIAVAEEAVFLSGTNGVLYRLQ